MGMGVNLIVAVIGILLILFASVVYLIGNFRGYFNSFCNSEGFTNSYYQEFTNQTSNSEMVNVTCYNSTLGESFYFNTPNDTAVSLS
jgi:hypothetical protein